MTYQEAYNMLNKSLPTKEFYVINNGTECNCLTDNRDKAIRYFLNSIGKYHKIKPGMNFPKTLKDTFDTDLKEILLSQKYYAEDPAFDITINAVNKES